MGNSQDWRTGLILCRGAGLGGSARAPATTLPARFILSLKTRSSLSSPVNPPRKIPKVIDQPCYLPRAVLQPIMTFPI